MRKRDFRRLVLWQASFAIFALASAAGQETHPHITSVTWVVSRGTLDWDSREFGANERPAAGNTEHFHIVVRDRLMATADEERRFSLEEADKVGRVLDAMVEFISQKILGLGGRSSLDSITWEPPTATIELKVKESSLRTYTVTQAKLLIDDKDKSAVVPDDAYAALAALSRAVVQYAGESTVWWHAGLGEPVAERFRALLQVGTPPTAIFLPNRSEFWGTAQFL